MWLPWRAALWCALVLALISLVVRPNGRLLRTVVDVSRESAILTLVYAAWIRLGEISIASAGGARSRPGTVLPAPRSSLRQRRLDCQTRESFGIRGCAQELSAVEQSGHLPQ